MRLIVYPNGTGSGANTHMSVFIYLIKGKYDSILSWPFRGVVKVILYYAGDQEISCIDRFLEFSDAGSRVLNGTMSAHGLGCHRLSHKYITVNDNTLYFAIKVLSPGNSASYWMPSIKFPDIIVVFIVSVVCIMLAKCIQ